MKKKCISSLMVVSLVTVASAVPLKENALSEITLRGVAGARFRDCLSRHVMTADLDVMADVFTTRIENVGGWRGEFWGKYMHSSVPFAQMTGDAKLRAAIVKSMNTVMGAQEADGYIGCYAAGSRSDRGWDVWGNKYTLMGLLYGYELTGDSRVLESAKRLADYLIGQFGEGRREICKTGNWLGLASGSVLEPIVKLYTVTKERKYLDFAGKIVAELDAEDGPRLLRDADVKPGDRRNDKPTSAISTRKAYEMMSCYQGLADYALVTGDRKILDTVIKVAKSIAENEITIVGGGAAAENWYHGRENQAGVWSRSQETCVTTTWMRLCEKMLTVTGDPFWADQIERSFYNAYLASLKTDGSHFDSYTPLRGTRANGNLHCYLETDCCNANGPRGFLTYLSTAFMTGADDKVYLNWYDSADVRARLSSGAEVRFENFSYYPSGAKAFPCDNHVHLAYRSPETRMFTLMLRIPAWSGETTVELRPFGWRSNEDFVRLEGAKAGTYYAVTRTWKPGDVIEINFDMSCRKHVLGNYVAFTAGPIVLTRATRFDDGDLSEGLREKDVAKLDPAGSYATVAATDTPDTWIEYALNLPIGEHVESVGRNGGRVIRFCDFASAGNRWSSRDFYRVWLPLDRGAIW